MFKPRPAQEEVLNYHGGKMGVSAVPGSGKTHTLSNLASRLIVEGHIEEDQEILIVTLVNSSVENFNSRIAGFIKQSGFLPGVNYRVRTLHGLAHDIIRERPDLAGLSNEFRILDSRDAEDILTSVSLTWIKSNPDLLMEWTDPGIDLHKNQKAYKGWKELLKDAANAFIRQAKDLNCSPDLIRAYLDRLKEPVDILEMGWQLYHDYQQALNYRNAVDFDDLIQLALRVLQSDPEYLARLRHRWPFILEDEAQDSSRLQEEILRLLTGEDGNWVRVGDPNQAIYESFTTASPQYLRNFLLEPGVIGRTLPVSGRSTISIIDLANQLNLWTQNKHPVPELRGALTDPLIKPTDPGDPQHNPDDQPEAVILHLEELKPEKELELVAKSIARWLPAHADDTVAILVPRNERGSKVIDELEKREIPYLELLQSSLPTREAAGVLAAVLRSLGDPTAQTRLSDAYHRLRSLPVAEGQQVDAGRIKNTIDVLRKCSCTEDFLWPMGSRDWLADLERQGINDETIFELEWLRSLFHRWHSAVNLPVDQLILTISQDIFTTAVDLALAHKLALLLKQTEDLNPDYQLPEFVQELESISQNRRKLAGFGEEDSGFNPDSHKGKVVVATIHKAKGLEWDRVYLLSVNNYDFPSALPEDTFIGEKWFVRGRLNLQAEVLARLKGLIKGDLSVVYMDEGIPTREARFEYASERLRLLYVGITRARKDLVITWNTGRPGSYVKATPAIPLTKLSTFGES